MPDEKCRDLAGDPAPAMRSFARSAGDIGGAPRYRCAPSRDSLQALDDAATSVLYGDSTSSTLPPNILDIVVALVGCAVSVADSHVQITGLDKQERDGSAATDEILADLDAFQKHAELGLAATIKHSLRGELRHHGAEVVSTVLGMVDGWRSRYLGNLEEARGLIAKRRAALLASMRQAIDTFALPLAQASTEAVINRAFDGTAYRDEMTCTVVPGVRVRLSLADTELEVPRRLRTLLGKGAKMEIGTKLSRIRKIEEPAVFALDDQVIVEAHIESHRAQVHVTKKPGTPGGIKLELAPVADGAAARGTRADGEQAVVPESDAPLVLSLWKALQAEGKRIAASPARVLSLTLDDEEVEGPAALLATVERLVGHYRPTIAAIADRSPNVEELAIKHETADGKREEVWIKRAELGQRLATLPPEMLLRVGVPELHSGGKVVPSASPVPSPITEADGGDHSERIDVRPPPPPPKPPVGVGSGVPAKTDETEDISLLDLDVLVEEISNPATVEDGCVEPPRVRSRGPS